MKQIMQSLKDGSIEIIDAPCPAASSGSLLIATRVSLVSAGTERMLVEFGKANMVNKALQQPDKVRMVLEKARTDGFATTIEAVRSKLGEPLPLGYCNVGILEAIGTGVTGFSIGDRVVSNGKHADMVCVPKNLCSRVSDDVSDEHAAFTVLGAIGLQGIRLVNPTLGECVVVTGLGLIGLMTVQMLIAQGCRVMGIDTNPARLTLAKRFGATVANAKDDVVAAGLAFSRGRGVDAVIITASTSSNEPVSQAAKMCRKRGRIVLVGVTGLNLSRADFFEKELSFQVSCSYGPGRYDSAYEDGGQDYPIGYVRWTEQRNFEAVLDLMQTGKIDVTELITHRFPFESANEAYALLASNEPCLGITLNYPIIGDASRPSLSNRTIISSTPSKSTGCGSNFALLGAGNYASRILAPAFIRAGAKPHTIVSAQGLTASISAKRHGFAAASTDSLATINEPDVDIAVIATRHDVHASQVLAALRAGKHVFCEKPLCLTLAELEEIEREAVARPGQKLMVGFNRRFAPTIIMLKSLMSDISELKSFIMTVNAGEIPADHWTQDMSVGGGRIIGEACHFVDLLRHLADAPIIAAHAVSLGRHPAFAVTDDKTTIVLSFADGSSGTIHYLANGNKGFPKERLEVFVGGRVLQLDNFLRLKGWGWNGFRSKKLWRQDKGVDECVRQFLSSVSGQSKPPITIAELIEVTRWSIGIAESLR